MIEFSRWRKEHPVQFILYILFIAALISTLVGEIFFDF